MDWVKRFWKWIKKGDWGDTELVHNWLFRLSILLPVTTGVVVSIIIGISSGYEWCGAKACFDFAYNAFKMPLTIAALSFPLSTLIGAAQYL